jgi:hypothetical protein
MPADDSYPSIPDPAWAILELPGFPERASTVADMDHLYSIGVLLRSVVDDYKAVSDAFKKARSFHDSRRDSS